MESENNSSAKDAPHVEIFGEEVQSGRRHGRGQNHGSGIVVGAIILLIGAILLLNNLGILSWEFWQLFWPGLLIILGMRLVLGNSTAARIVFLLIVILMFVMVLFYGLHPAVGSPFPHGF